MTASRTTVDLVRVQRRTVGVLVAGQVLGGLGLGASLSVGSILAAQVSGSEAWAGAAATLSTLGAAAGAIPLARFAFRAGRRPALATGAVVASVGAVLAVLATAQAAFPLLLLSFALLGVGSAVNLQSRFAATDVASPAHRGRDLSIVVWSTTVGAVVGPNLVGPGGALAAALALPVLAGPFVITAVAQLAAAALYLVALRPDPLVLGRALPRIDAQQDAGGIRTRSMLVFAIGAIGLSHAVMVSVMAMTPVHLSHHGSSLTVIGVTISLHIAGMFALSPVFGSMSDRIGPLPTILVGQGLFAAALATVALGAESPELVTIGLVLLGLGWSASTVAGSAMVAELVTGSAKTRVQGRTDLVMNVAGAGGGALAGPVLALVGYPGLAVAAGVLVLVVAVASALALRRGTTPAARPLRMPS